MKEDYKRIIAQIAKPAPKGTYGEVALSSSRDYEGVALDISSNNSIKMKAVYIFRKILIVVYRDCKRLAIEAARKDC